MIPDAINTLLENATTAGKAYAKVRDRDKAVFLRAIAQAIEDCGDLLLQIAHEETHLSLQRLRAERTRTIGQWLSFAALLEEGSWVRASIDTGDPHRPGSPKPDLRKMLFPLGPVVVFGASNFPFAYSTAGGDTAAALAAGCSVILKCHPAHPKTSSLVAQAIQQAIRSHHMPAHVFQHVSDTSLEIGQQLIAHPLTKAGAFTGSFQGGKALFDLAQQRKEPIPFFAEMGSTNPVLILPDAIEKNHHLVKLLSASITQGVGQFCTQPGLILTLENELLIPFMDELAAEVKKVNPEKMLHQGIAKAFHQQQSIQLSTAGVHTILGNHASDPLLASPTLAKVNAQDFLSNPHLKHEVFGPFSLVIICKSLAEMEMVIHSLEGQLTGSIFTHEPEEYKHLIDQLQDKCGRLIFNGVPTGVEVNRSMNHGGPFPSTTDGRFTSVGVDAIYRFVRAVSFQNFDQDLLPPALQNNNPLGIWRYINNELTKNAVN